MKKALAFSFLSSSLVSVLSLCILSNFSYVSSFSVSYNKGQQRQTRFALRNEKTNFVATESNSDSFVCKSFTIENENTVIPLDSTSLSYSGWDEGTSQIITEGDLCGNNGNISISYTNAKSSITTEDNRFLINHSSLYPISAIGAIDTNVSNVTGFFIRENLVLTAAHVVVGSNGCVYAPYFDVNYEDKNDGSVPLRYLANEVVIPKLYDYKKNDPNYDWAILKFDENIATEYGYLGTIANYSFKNQKTTCIGYYGQKPTRLYGTSSYGCKSESQYNAETYSYLDHGMSGGPVFSWVDGKPYVVGVNSGGFDYKKFLFFGSEGRTATISKISNLVNQMIRLLEMNDDEIEK